MPWALLRVRWRLTCSWVPVKNSLRSMDGGRRRVPRFDFEDTGGDERRASPEGGTMDTREWHDAFREHQYLILQEVLTEPLLSVAHEYAIKRALLSRETTSAGAAPGTPS